MIRDHSSVVVMLLPLMLPNPVLLLPPLLQLTHAAVAVTHTTTDHLSEGQSGTRKCTLIGTWAGTQGGLSRDSKRVNPGVLYGLRGQNSGQNSEQNYAGTKRVRQ